MEVQVALAGLDIGTVMLVVSLLSTAALVLTQKKPKLAKGDDAVESNATRGSYVPLVIGRHRVGPIFAWVRDMTDFVPLTGNDTPGFGKGGPSVGGTATYREEAMHLICVGPASRLIAIYENGEKIWQQEDFTPANIVSGSSVVIPAKGTFKVYWGFPDDPVVTAPSGIDYRMPQVFKILWLPKELGSSRNWGRLEYEVECPCYSQIATTPSEVPVLARYAETYGDLVGIPIQLGHSVAVPRASTDFAEFFVLGFDGVDTILLYDNTQYELASDPSSVGSYSFSTIQNELKQTAFRPGTILGIYTPTNSTAAAISGFGGTLAALCPNNNEFRQYRVVRTASKTVAFTGTGLLPATINFLAIEVQVALVVDDLRYISEPAPDTTPTRTTNNSLVLDLPISSTGTLFIRPRTRIGFAVLFEPDVDSVGTNPIHIMDQLLFARFPYGCGKDRTQHSAQSIENAAYAIQEERIRGNIRVKDGEGLESVLAGIMQDLGLFVAWDPKIGKYVFRLIRFVDPADVPEVPAEMVLSEPELKNVVGEKKADVIAFTFEDRTRNYRQEPIALTDTGQVLRQESSKATQVPIEVSTDFNSSARIAQRRQQEVLGDTALLSWEMNHVGTCAVPGDIFRAPSVEDPSISFRVTKVKADINTSRVTIDTLIDSYTQPTLTNDDFVPELAVQPRYEAPDYVEQESLEDFVAYEVPRALLEGQVGMLFLAVRSSSRTAGGRVWISRDGSSYQDIGDALIVARATLVDPLEAEVVDDGGTYSIANVSLDFSSRVQDLTLDPTSWRAGKQIMLVGDEIIFLRDGVDLGGGSGEISGLIRGRLGTEVAVHAEDTPIYILLAQSVSPLFSSAFVPEVDIDFKVQAYERSRAYDISLLTEKTVSLVGLSYTPTKVHAIRTAGFRTDYEAASAVTVVWSYSSKQYPRTGLGQQMFGQVCGLSNPMGYFLVDILDDADSVLASLQVDTASITLSSSDRGLYGLDALPFWKLAIRQIEGSFSSAPATIQLQAS